MDFISVKSGSSWLHYALEINLRKLGVTHANYIYNFLDLPTNNVYLTDDNMRGESLDLYTFDKLLQEMRQADILYSPEKTGGVVLTKYSCLPKEIAVVFTSDSLENCVELKEKLRNIIGWDGQYG